MAWVQRAGRRSKSVIIGIAVGCGVLLVALAAAAVYAFVQRRRAQKAKAELGGPFGTYPREHVAASCPYV